MFCVFFSVCFIIPIINNILFRLHFNVLINRVVLFCNNLGIHIYNKQFLLSFTWHSVTAGVIVWRCIFNVFDSVIIVTFVFYAILRVLLSMVLSFVCLFSCSLSPQPFSYILTILYIIHMCELYIILSAALNNFICVFVCVFECDVFSV